MATTGSTAVEKTQYGVIREYTVGEGTATAVSGDSIPEYSYGQGDTGGYTYATPVRDGVFLIWDTSADFKVKRAGTDATGKTLIGIAMGASQGAAGGVREVRCYHFGNWDVLRLEAGATAAGVIAIAKKVSLDGAYSSTKLHGFAVKEDTTNGFGYTLNSTAAEGEFLALLMRPGSFDAL